MTTRGRKFTMNALVITGNGKGLVGYAVAKSNIFRPMAAVATALKAASRKLFHVELLEDRTIYQDFYAECRNTRIFAQRCPPGHGLHCHPRLIKICEVIFFFLFQFSCSLSWLLLIGEFSPL